MARVEAAKMRDAGGVVRAGDVLQPGAVGRAQAVAVQVRVDGPVREIGGGEVGEKRHRSCAAPAQWMASSVISS